MTFDFSLFSRLAANAYSGIENPLLSLNTVLAIFGYYFQQYEVHTGHSHPPIRTSQISSIIQRMPYVSDSIYPSIPDFDDDENAVLCYEAMIDKHFKTRYRNCDYNINHFFSGRIRELRFFEELY